MNGVGAMRNPGIEIQGYRAVYSIVCFVCGLPYQSGPNSHINIATGRGV